MSSLGSIILKYSKLLHNSSTPFLDVEILLSKVLSVNKTNLLLMKDIVLSCEHERELISLCQLRSQFMPIAYIVGVKEFFSLDFFVNKYTLVPRPETECIVEWALNEFKGRKTLNVLDLGTGSGNIAVSMAVYNPGWSIDAVDISMRALQIGFKNARAHNVTNINFTKSDWYSSVTKQYDLIISNPPYVKKNSSYLAKMPYEPTLALVAADNGLSEIRKVIQGAQSRCKMLAIEHAFDQGNDVRRLMELFGFVSTTHCDQFGKERFSVGMC